MVVETEVSAAWTKVVVKIVASWTIEVWVTSMYDEQKSLAAALFLVLRKARRRLLAAQSNGSQIDSLMI